MVWPAPLLAARVYTRIRQRLVIQEWRGTELLAGASAAGCALLLHPAVVRAPAHRLDGEVGRDDEVAQSDRGPGARVDGHLVITRHVDGIFRAGVDAVAAEDTAEQIDVVADGELLARTGVLAGLDGDALGRARRRAHVARHAARGPVLTRGEDGPSAETLRVDALDLRVRDDWRVLHMRHVVE